MICACKCILNQYGFTSHHNGLWHLRERLVYDAVCLWLIHRLQQTDSMMAHHFILGSLACRWQKSMISHIWQLSVLWLTISPSIIRSSSSPSCHLNYIKPYSRNASLHSVPESVRLSANPCASHILSASEAGCVFTLLSSGSTVLASCQRQIIPDFPLWGETVSLWLMTA